MSSFAGENLFSSGPHRIASEPEGALVVPKLSLRIEEAGSRVIGPLEVAVLVTGRLVAADDAALDTLLTAIRAKLHPDFDTGTLTDNHGRSWSDMRFVKLTLDDRIDRGRVVSVAYTARFLRLI